MKRTVVYHWEEKDIRGGVMAYPARGNPLLIGYVVTPRGNNEYVLIDQRDGLVMRNGKWATKKAMAAYLSTTHSPVEAEEAMPPEVDDD